MTRLIEEKLFALLAACLVYLNLASDLIDGNSDVNVSLARNARGINYKFKYLIFPEGSNVQLVYCLTIASLGKPSGLFTFGVTAGLAYELPYKRILPLAKSAEAYHRKSRRDLYHKLEKMLDTQKTNGRKCILWALCEAGRRNREQTGRRVKKAFLEEILHSIFTFPTRTDRDSNDEAEEHYNIKLQNVEYEKAYNLNDDCNKLFDSCPRFF